VCVCVCVYIYIHSSLPAMLYIEAQGPFGSNTRLLLYYFVLLHYCCIRAKKRMASTRRKGGAQALLERAIGHARTRANSLEPASLNIYIWSPGVTLGIHVYRSYYVNIASCLIVVCTGAVAPGVRAVARGSAQS
jgi:hypothetical protein